MKKRIISFLIAVVCCISCLSLAGCGKKKSQVYFLNFKPEAASVYEEIAKTYEEETGVKV